MGENGIVCTKCKDNNRTGYMKVNYSTSSISMKCSNPDCDSEY